MSDLREAAERYRNSDYEDNVGGSFHRQEDAETLADAYLASPAWQDKPTVPGLWLFDFTDGTVSTATITKIVEGGSLVGVRRCYGPIPSDEA